MKSVILIRHAKSSWESAQQRDFDRPLNDRGNKDAPAMASRLKIKVPHIDLFVSSPANRTLSTASFFAKTYEVKDDGILQKPELYHAPPHIFYDVISKLDNAYDTITIFSHNGGITDFVNGLTSTKIDSMPTCSVFAVKADIKNWEEFFGATKSFWFFDYPKNI